MNLRGQRLEAPARRLINNFAGRPEVALRHVATLTRVITNSPILIKQLNAAVAAGDLRRFDPLDPATTVAAAYEPDDRTLRLSLIMLADGKEAPIASALGHELQHVLNTADTLAADHAFFTAIDDAARGDHDYTEAVRELIMANCTDEAAAGLAGWNALIDVLRAKNSHLTLSDVWMAAADRAADILIMKPDGALEPRVGIELKPDLRIDPSRASLEAMIHNCLSRRPEESGFGELGSSDFANYRGAWCLDAIIEAHRGANPPEPGTPEHPMIIRLDELGLSAMIMEHNGIDLDIYRQPIPYLDPSTDPVTEGVFHHTAAQTDPPPGSQLRPTNLPSLDALRRPVLAAPDLDLHGHNRRGGGLAPVRSLRRDRSQS